MEPQTSPERQIGAYLAEVRAGLRGMPKARADEIVAELASHIRERAHREGEWHDEALTDALAGLGSPKELAGQYVGDAAPAQYRRPLLSGVLGLLGSVAAAVLAASFAAAALAKPLFPERAGLWRVGDDTYSLRLGLTGSPAPGTDLLGWWMVPLGLALGAVLLFSSARLGAWSLRRLGLPAARPLLLWEMLAVLAVFVADVHGLVPFSKTPFLVLIGWASLRLRGLSWRDVGLRRPASWPLTLLLGLAAGVAIQRIELSVLVPVLHRLTGEVPDVSDLRVLVGNPMVLAIALALNWTLAAFGEEMAHRGYLMNRVAEVLGGRAGGWMLSLLLVNVAFGFGHGYQGLPGQVENAVSGLLLGALYLACRRNLWVPVLAHGVSNSIDLVLIFLGTYPGI